jgi:hypothetical protein
MTTIFPEPRRVVVLWMNRPNESSLCYEIGFNSTGRDAEDIAAALDRLAPGSVKLEQMLRNHMPNSWVLSLNEQWGSVIRELKAAIESYDGKVVI